MSESRFLIGNASGIVCEAPPVTVLLESQPGAYTTTRTHNKVSCLLFWERHLKRLSQSIQILLRSNPQLLFQPNSPAMSVSPSWEHALKVFVDSSLKRVLPFALKERSGVEELAITTLVSGKMDELPPVLDEGSFVRAFDVNVHVGTYVPQAFGILQMGARLAVVGHGRDLAAAKYSNWVRIRKPLEKLRPPLVTELLLSNDGDRILEGCVTNFFIVRRIEADEAKPLHEKEYVHSFELQTAPIDDGILPGIIRQLVLEVCMSMGIPIREVPPSYSEHQMWEEAFITNSLRLIQFVDTIMVPREWKSADYSSWKEIEWEEKKFKEGPGFITSCIQKELMRRATLEGYPVSNFM